MNHDTLAKDISEKRNEIINTHGISNDREMYKRLNLSDEDKKLVMDWVTYQCLYTKREGYEHGVEDYSATEKYVTPAKPRTEYIVEGNRERLDSILYLVRCIFFFCVAVFIVWLSN